MRIAAVVSVLVVLTACSGMPRERSFGEDVRFLKDHPTVVVLTADSSTRQGAVVPAYQGRVMTSTTGGEDGPSFGWINYAHVSSGKLVPHINVFGGEDRFWMGPEGGQFAIFFPKGSPFDLEHWQTPPVIDTDTYTVVSAGSTQATFEKKARFTNWSGTTFDVRIDRVVRLLDDAGIGGALGVSIPDGVAAVGYETDNRITNTGRQAWKKETGLLSIWILGMFKHSPDTTVVVPFVPGPETKLGRKVNDEYFGKVPADRLIVKDDVLFFKGDGRYRSKIGIPPKRAKTVAGSYNESGRVLTLVQYTKPGNAVDYVNSMWEMQKKPFAGDVVNSYNDGPPAPGKKPLGPFYELETSSPAAALAPGKTISHVHRTFHFTGPEKDLDTIARRTLGMSLPDIKAAF